MRGLSTDRPDTTESPHTVDAGHVQLEMSLIDVSFDRSDGTDTTTLSAAPFLFKIGLLHHVDVQLGAEPYTRVTTDTDGSGTTTDGSGDFLTRMKFNLWGNDNPGESGESAFALMPFVKFPAGSRGLTAERIEGGLIAPLGIQLAPRWGMGLMAEIDAIYDQRRAGHVLDFVHTITIAFEATDRLGFFAEYAGFASANQHELYRGYANTGASFAITPDIQFDAGVRIGLTAAAEDIGAFLGLTLRY